MNDSPANPAVPLETLLAHADWVRALARRLVADPASADDVEQEVWRAALENPPREETNPRGWLASVARNAARSLGRQRTRRAARERRVARAEALPATSELVAETELSRELAGEVLALEEPYRTVLLLRYWRALDVDAIARAQSLPRETVRTQLRRGLERLRERLDRRFGAREAWIAALAPLARESSAPLAAAAGAGVLAFALKLGAAAALAALVWWAWPASTRHTEELARGEHAAEPAATALESSESAPTSRERALAQAAPAVNAPRGGSSAQPGAPHTLAGHVVDLVHAPVGGVELEWKRQDVPPAPHWEGTRLVLSRGSVVEIPPQMLEQMRAHPEEIDKVIAEVGDEPGLRAALLGTPPRRFLARTRADGGFEIELPEGSWTIVPTDGHSSIVAELSNAGAPDWTLLLAPCVKLAGIVVDAEGSAVPGAIFSYHLDLDRLDGFAHNQANVRFTSILPAGGDDGRFAIECMPVGSALTLEVQATGFVSRSVELSSRDETDLRIVLARPEKVDRPVLAGLVLDEHGAPAPQAWVSLGQDGGATDASGRFAFALSIGHAAEPLTATLAGVQAAVLEDFGRERMSSQSEILLRLGPPALSIEGRVLLPDGSSPGRCRVQLIDGTQQGSNSCTIEDVCAGHYQSGVESDEAGRFVLGGLRSREYRLLAHSTTQGQIALSAPIAAGTKDVLLQDPPSAFFPRLAGRLVTRHGVPLADADVYLSIPTFLGHGSTESASHGRVQTDAQGRFELHDVPRQWCRIGVSGASVKMEDHPVPASAEGELVLVATLEVRTRVEVADARVDTIEFLDAQGKAVHPWVERPNCLSAQASLEREQGSFYTLRITDAAEIAVLKQGSTELRRVPIEIRRENLLLLRF